MYKIYFKIFTISREVVNFNCECDSYIEGLEKVVAYCKENGLEVSFIRECDETGLM